MTSLGINIPQLLHEPSTDGATISALDGRLSIRDRFHRILTLIEVLADGLTVTFAVISVYAAYHFLHFDGQVEYSGRLVCLLAFATSAIFVILLGQDGAYQLGNSLLRIRETERSLRASFQTFFLLLFLVLPIMSFSTFQPSRWVFVIALLCVPVLQVVEKHILFQALRALRSRGFGAQRVLIYGAGSTGRRVFSAFVRSPKLGLHPVAVVDDDASRAGEQIFEYSYRRDHSVEVISAPLTREMLEKFRCNFLVLAIPSLKPEKFAELVSVARSAKVRLAFVPREIPDFDYWTEHANIDGILLSVVGHPSKLWHHEVGKRYFDICVASMLLLFVVPIFLMAALLVRAESNGPVFFRQQRVGRDGKLFEMYKFRSMFVDAPAYAYSPKEAVDPRITKVGSVLRRTSLDELPQLLNVLKGEMSLVGPRPEMPFIVESYNTLHRQRLQVTPGITGLWQLSADRAYLIHENIQYDLYYIRNRNFFMDCAILLHTLIFAMRGV